MATTVDTLLVRIEADMSDLKRSLDKMDKDIKRSTVAGSLAFNKLGTAIKAIAGAVVVQQLARAGASAVLFAADIQEMQSKSQVVFGAFRGDVVDALTTFGNEVGRSRFELESMASTLQDTFVPLGFARGEASKLSVEMTKLAVDVASFNNASDVETMQAFQSALVGNHETVRRFGIIITEATLNQELMRMGIEKGTKAATEQQKVMARMNLIMNGVTDAQGDAARTADSFANQLKAAKSSTQELSNAIGVALMPMATTLLTTFNEMTVSILNAGIAMGIFAAEPKKKLELVTDEINQIKRALLIMDEMAGATEVGSNARPEAVGLIMDLGGAEAAQKRLEELRETAAGLRQEIDNVNATADAAKKAQEEIDANNSSTKTLTKSEREAADAVKAANKEIVAKTGKLAAQTLNEMSLAKAIADGNVEAEKQARYQIELNKLKEEYPELIKDNYTALENLARVEVNRTMMLNSQKETLEATKEAQEDYAASVQRGIEHIQSAIYPSSQFKETLTDIENAMRSGKISTDDYKAAMAALELQMLEQNPVGNIFLNGFTQMADGVSNALADMAMGGKVTLRSFTEMFKGFVRQMLAQALKLLIVNAILRAMGVPLRYTGSGFEAGAGGAFGQKLAGGGTAQPNRPVLVGERGPEIFVPHSAGKVMNNHNTSQALGGSSPTIVNQTINVETGVSQTVRAEMISLLPRFRADAMRAVSDANMRGGTYRSSLA